MSIVQLLSIEDDRSLFVNPWRRLLEYIYIYIYICTIDIKRYAISIVYGILCGVNRTSVEGFGCRTVEFFNVENRCALFVNDANDF